AAFVEKLADNIKPIGGNVLIIDDAQKHSPTTRADSLCELEKILAHCDDWGPDPEKPVVIFLGDDDLLKFFENNPSARARIKELLTLNAPDIPDLVEICARRLVQVWHCKPVDADVRAKIGRVITYAKRSNPDTFPNGHFAHSLADRIYEAYCNSGAAGGCITPDMVVGTEYVPKTLDDVMRDFDKYVGVEDIKEQIRLISLAVDDARRRGGDTAAAGSVKSHFVFIGNPGTGKTTMARLFAEALSAMGALPSGHLVEVDRGKLVSQYVGETPKLVRKAVNDAMGGVLFIDEAYELCRDENDTYGNQAIATLLKDCEDLRGKFVCLLAGYPVEMQRMLGSNPGLQSRFNKTIEFRDYKGPELTQIFRNMAAAGDDPLKLDDEAEAGIAAFFDKMYATRTARFGNARSVRNVLDEARARMKQRIDRAVAGGDAAPLRLLTMRDIEGENAAKAVDDILASFDDLVGMADVKRQISGIARRVRLNRRRMAAGRGKVMVDNIHIIITGNPGTGKTTVAKRLGKVFKAIGAIL
ncbi:MAG: AAA family ATPase, partial [Muribaculaceae bacterium]|nr:AAA family ATPase [Muribaculaceae bacterium]